MPDTSTISLQIRTGSADNNGLLMLLDGQLVAILIELAEPIHEGARGRWSLETFFGDVSRRAPETFAGIEQAWDWILRALHGEPWRVVESRRPSV